MIEKCNYCGETHETGIDASEFPIPFKICPKVPANGSVIVDNVFYKHKVDQKLLLRQRISVLGLNNPIIAHCLRAKHHNELDEEESLLQMIVALGEANNNLTEQIFRMHQIHGSPLIGQRIDDVNSQIRFE